MQEFRRPDVDGSEAELRHCREIGSLSRHWLQVRNDEALYNSVSAQDGIDRKSHLLCAVRAQNEHI